MCTASNTDAVQDKCIKRAKQLDHRHPLYVAKVKSH